MPRNSLAIREDALAICSKLLSLDTTNFGDDSGPGERAAAEYVRELLENAGYTTNYVESEPKRGTVYFRIPGRDPSRPALVVHGHLDVVPAVASDWKHDPLCADVIDGELWGRGAVDMKDMDAMILAAILDMKRSGWRPARDLIVVFFADEEHGGILGSQWMQRNRPEVFDGASEAISEVGGFSTMVGGRRVYLMQTAEKGLAWLRLIAEGPAGHGSALHPDNAVKHVVEALARIAAFDWGVHVNPAVDTLLSGVADLTGLPYDPADPETLHALIDAMGPAKRFVGTSLSTVANLTSLKAGYLVNVVPSRAEATVDIRPLPDRRDEVTQVVNRLKGERVRVEPINEDVGTQAPFGTDFTDAMVASLHRHDPDGVVLPYLLSAGTDNKALSKLGIKGYGFVPVKLPEDFDFTALFHGVDERIPVESLQFGAEVIADLLENC